jgi:hypothetical protein
MMRCPHRTRGHAPTGPRDTAGRKQAGSVDVPPAASGWCSGAPVLPFATLAVRCDASDGMPHTMADQTVPLTHLDRGGGLFSGTHKLIQTHVDALIRDAGIGPCAICVA